MVGGVDRAVGLEEDKLVEKEIAESPSVGEGSDSSPVCMSAKSLYTSNEDDSA